jgi:hypothetical protein
MRFVQLRSWQARSSPLTVICLNQTLLSVLLSLLPGRLMSEDQAKAIDRMVRNEVPAAVLGVVSRDAAKGIPEIDGYQIFRVPLSPG